MTSAPAATSNCTQPSPPAPPFTATTRAFHPSLLRAATLAPMSSCAFPTPAAVSCGQCDSHRLAYNTASSARSPSTADTPLLLNSTALSVLSHTHLLSHTSPLSQHRAGSLGAFPSHVGVSFQPKEASFTRARCHASFTRMRCHATPCRHVSMPFAHLCLAPLPPSRNLDALGHKHRQRSPQPRHLKPGDAEGAQHEAEAMYARCS